MTGEKLTTAQNKPRHKVETLTTTLSSSTQLPKKTTPCSGLPGFAPSRTWTASGPKRSPSSVLVLVLLGFVLPQTTASHLLVQSSTSASLEGDSSGRLPFCSPLHSHNPTESLQHKATYLLGSGLVLKAYSWVAPACPRSHVLYLLLPPPPSPNITVTAKE